VRVLAYTSPARGHLYPIVPIMARLADHGHEVTAYTLSTQLEHLRALSIAGVAIDPQLEQDQLEDWRKRTPVRSALVVLRTFARRALRDAPDMQRAIERHRPDVALVDINCWGAAVVAEASGVPWTMFAPYVLPLPSRDAPPFGPGLHPADGLLGRARDRIIHAIGDRTIDRVTMPTINSIRVPYGLQALDGYPDTFARPPLLLALTAEGFDYPRSDWPANVRLVGPINWAPPEQPPEWLQDMPDPLVLVTCSTEHQRDKRLVRAALAALPGAGMSVLATTAAHDPSEFPAPPGARVVRFVSHEAVLARAACVVCHGGMGITQKALAAGVPVVVVPFGRDQAETASRVAAAEAGVRVSPAKLTPARLLDAVERAMACRDGALRMRRTYAEAGGAQAAVDAIELLARDHSAIASS
jgi:MGT family glycosyltransferase